MEAYQSENLQILKPNLRAQQYFAEEDSGFKAWDVDNVLTENAHVNMLRNFKSQLLTYEKRFKRLESNKTVPFALPVVSYMKLKKPQKKYTVYSHHQQLILTERKPLNTQKNLNVAKKHKSIDLNKRSIQSQNQKQNLSFNKLQARQRNHTIDHMEQKNQPIVITKVQEMKFVQNQKRVRKRDLYLALFGDKGKGKVQRIEFDDENKAYQTYLQRKNQQLKNPTTTNIKNAQKQQHIKLRCSSQLNNRKKQQIVTPCTQSINFIVKNNSHHQPIRY